MTSASTGVHKMQSHPGASVGAQMGAQAGGAVGPMAVNHGSIASHIAHEKSQHAGHMAHAQQMHNRGY